MHKIGGSQSPVWHKKCAKIIVCFIRLYNKALSESVPLQAGNEVIPVFHKYGQYNGNDNGKFALR